MDLDDYQRRAQSTDQYSDTEDDGTSLIIPVLGAIGELGSLITCFKKRIRDDDAYSRFLPDLKEEIGDILWYLANMASKFDLSLSEIAEENLSKTADRWPSTEAYLANHHLYDTEFPSDEQLPRTLTIQFRESYSADDQANVCILRGGRIVGDTLTDNAHENDGYRFHDAFHMAYAAILGWSPVLRHLLKTKRKSDLRVDEVQDGARARIIEEAISLYIFAYAKEHNHFDNVSEIDQDVLSTIKNLVSGLEVSDRTAHEWKIAIFEGYKVYRKLLENSGGLVTIDLDKRTIEYAD